MENVVVEVVSGQRRRCSVSSCTYSSQVVRWYWQVDLSMPRGCTATGSVRQSVARTPSGRTAVWAGAATAAGRIARGCMLLVPGIAAARHILHRTSCFWATDTYPDIRSVTVAARGRRRRLLLLGDDRRSVDPDTRAGAVDAHTAACVHHSGPAAESTARRDRGGAAEAGATAGNGWFGSKASRRRGWWSMRARAKAPAPSCAQAEGRCGTPLA